MSSPTHHHTLHPVGRVARSLRDSQPYRTPPHLCPVPKRKNSIYVTTHNSLKKAQPRPCTARPRRQGIRISGKSRRWSTANPLAGAACSCLASGAGASDPISSHPFSHAARPPVLGSTAM